MPVTDDPVRRETRGSHLLLTIDHPPANAISRAVVGSLRDALQHAEATESIRTIVITGAGTRFFSAGADVTEFRSEGGEAIADGQLLTLQIESLSKPVLCAVNGIALGGGCELAMSCDVRIAARTAKFGQPEIRLGIIPGWGGTQRLPRLVGRSVAVQLLLTGESIDAERALSIGLVSEVVEGEELLARVEDLAERIGAQAPLAVEATKRAVADGDSKPIAKALDSERHQFFHVFKSDDAQEGIGAFLEKRTPTWKGR